MVGVQLATLTISGQNFTAVSQVMIDGQPQSSQEVSYVNPTTLQLYFDASLNASAAVHQITVQNLSATSNSMPYTVYAPQQGPSVMQATPGFLVAENEDDPTVIAAADVNGDGLADVVMPSPCASGGGCIAILFGQSDGTLSTAQLVPAGGSVPYALAVGDVDGNGTPDLVSITTDAQTATVSILLGDGHGNFQSPVAEQTFPTSFPSSATLADLDGDGRTDLLLAVQSASGLGGSVVWLKNTGGSFGAPITLSAYPGNYKDFSVADFNGDGRPDILYVATDTSFHILFNQGNGKFTDQVVPSLSGLLGTVAVMDFNLDGIPDLVVDVPQGTSGAVLYSLQGVGNGSFTQVASMTIQGIGPFVAGDFDNDGFPDLADSGGSYYFGDGKGNFAPQAFVGPAGNLIAEGDFNGDGIPDVVIPDYLSAFVTLSLGRKDRNFPSALVLYPAGVAGASVGDINGDGLPDIFVYGGIFEDIPTAGTVFMNQGNSSFTLAAYTDPSSFEIADMTDKGVVDLLGSPGETLEIWPNNGTANFSSSPISLSPPMTSITVADMDGDGFPDIVSASGQIFYGKGNYQFTQMNIASSFGDYVIGDFNGDGKLDIASDQGTFLNTGNRTFQQVASGLPLGNGALTVVGDFNGDGKDDVAINTPGDETIAIYYSAGDGTFYQGSVIDAAQSPSGMAVGDFNGDGKLDLAVGLESGHEVCLLFNSGNGQFTRSFFASGALAIGVVTADLNHNGKTDLLIGNFVIVSTPPNVHVIFHQ